jgi:hypothetical protein
MRECIGVLAAILYAVTAAFAAPQPPAPAAPAAAVAPAAPLTPELLKSVDEAIDRALFAVEDVETLAAGGADGSSCPKGVTAQAVEADLKANKYQKDLAGLILMAINKNGEQWELYHVCAAFASKNPGVCTDMVTTDVAVPAEQLKEHPEWTMRGRCSVLLEILPVYRAYDAKDATFVEKCAGLAPSFDGLTSPEALRNACVALAAYKGDPEPFAAAYSQAVSPAPSHDEILQILQKLTADQKSCAGLNTPVQRDVCRERGAFQRAVASKDKSSCRSPLCRAFAGEPVAVCEPYAAPVKKAACAAVNTPRFVDEQTRIFQGLSDQVVAALSNAGLENLKAVTATNQRIDKIFALRARLDAAADRVAPKTLPAKPVKPARPQ